MPDFDFLYRRYNRDSIFFLFLVLAISHFLSFSRGARRFREWEDGF